MTRTAAQVRQEFLDFFCRKHGHAFVPSSPLVPHDDPTLLFANAGMNQFKPLFLGTADPATAFGKLKRAANTQKCIRAGGKHNDLDDVGHDTYHHTFFEMLGNWSFGDYFKAEAIAWAWELLVDIWGLDPTRLHATYFGGDPEEGLGPDLEALELWGHYLPVQRVHAGHKKDNFWEMGDTGPCGPCSEIHIDLTHDKTGGELVNAGDPRCIEIWNLVFIQYNRGADGKLAPLPARHVDTGMGFERVTAVLQGHNNNYATDVFVPIIQAIERRSGHAYGESTGVPAATDAAASPKQREQAATAARYAVMRAGNMQDEACRVIADHVRCLTFALTDGAVPDREGRGYVLRRILRRAVRFGWQYLNLREPFLCGLVDTVVETMGGAFSELTKAPQRVKDTIREEEEAFEATLDRGIALFSEAADRAARHPGREIRGDDAFKLHDTFGFPIDLTQVMAEERGLKVDIGEYERLMEEARTRARAGVRGDADAFFEEWRPQAVPICDDSPKYAPDLRCEGTIQLLHVYDHGQSADAADEAVVIQSGSLAITTHEVARAGRPVAIVTDRTCFYAESGGQVSDVGTLRTDTGEVQIRKTLGPSPIHCGYVAAGEVRVGQRCTLEVDPHRRATMKNHTATHVLNWALREVLGDHVQQKGSLVDPEKTRFDFSHPKALTPEEIEQVETRVNEQIARRLDVYDAVVPQQEALRISGLRAVFGERYPDRVRVMSIGVPVADLLANPGNPDWRRYSIEFCGGTHLKNTGDIERFVLTHEEAVAKGIRRVVGMTGPNAALVSRVGDALLLRAKTLLIGPAEDVPAALAELQATLQSTTIPLAHRLALRELVAELQRIAKEQQKASFADDAAAIRERVGAMLDRVEKRGETSLVVGDMGEATVDQLRTAADMAKQKCGSAAVLLATRIEGKAILLAAMTPDLVKRGLKAGDLIKAVAPIVGGGGGGPPTMAQAGGRNPQKIEDALRAGHEWINQRL